MPKRDGKLNVDNVDSLEKAVKVIRSAIRRTKDTKELHEEIAEYIRDNFLKELYEELQITPPQRRRGEKPEYANLRQKKLIMLLRRRMGVTDGPTPRTNKLISSWELDAQPSRRGSGVRISIENTDEKSKFVVGKVGFGKSASSIRRYTKPIQKMHKDRWTPAHQIISPAVTKIEAYYEERIEEWAEEVMDMSDVKE